jgi:dienelactone hydrolase
VATAFAVPGALSAAGASADERVKFAEAGQSDTIEGYLTKPRGAGPFPAVVLLHTCLGLPEARAEIGGRVAGWGYAALFVDDFATRGLKETCSVDFNEAVPDAYGALAYLAGLPFVDPARIAAVGFSQGGDTALKIAAGVGAASPGADGPAFKAAAAFYAPCANLDGARLKIPTLILVGGHDSVTPAGDCAQLAARQPPGMAQILVYPGAEHGFDLPEFTGGRRVLGMPLAYDRKAASQSWARLRAFLAAQLGR